MQTLSHHIVCSRSLHWLPSSRATGGFCTESDSWQCAPLSTVKDAYCWNGTVDRDLEKDGTPTNTQATVQAFICSPLAKVISKRCLSLLGHETLVQSDSVTADPDISAIRG